MLEATFILVVAVAIFVDSMRAPRRLGDKTKQWARLTGKTA